MLLTNDGRALQELLGPTTPGRWSVMGLPDARFTDGADADEDRRSDRTSDAVAARIPSSAAAGSCSRCRCRWRRLTEGSPARGEELVVYDNLGAGPGSLIGLSEGREAANPFGKTKTPVDAYCACLIDQLSF